MKYYNLTTSTSNCLLATHWPVSTHSGLSFSQRTSIASVCAPVRDAQVASTGSSPRLCQDPFVSNATPAGGVFGLLDAAGRVAAEQARSFDVQAAQLGHRSAGPALGRAFLASREGRECYKAVFERGVFELSQLHWAYCRRVRVQDEHHLSSDWCRLPYQVRVLSRSISAPYACSPTYACPLASFVAARR